MEKVKRLIVAITGASGAIYGIKILESLRETDIETHLIISKAAAITITTETAYKVSEIQKLANICYHHTDIAAAISSGSFKTMGMVVAPCSARTMMGIANGGEGGLIIRAADVVLKEQRKLVLMLRETPLHLGHLRAMVTLSEIGAIIAPPVPAFYNHPQTIEDLVTHSVGRVFDLFEIDTALVQRWPDQTRSTQQFKI